MSTPSRRVPMGVACCVLLVVILGCLGGEVAAPVRWSTVPAGTYTIGCTPGQQGRCGAHEAMRTVTLTHAVSFAVTEVTQGEWAAVMGNNPASSQSCGLDCPVQEVSWYDAVAYANRLSARDGLEACYTISGTDVAWPAGPGCAGYRLPTDSEWEVAARGGVDTLYAGGDDLVLVGWSGDYTRPKRLHPVAQLAPNGYGLYDMSGNVWEWTWDWYQLDPGSGTDPLGPEWSLLRGRRGGSFTSEQSSQVADRNEYLPGVADGTIGLRTVRTLP